MLTVPVEDDRATVGRKVREALTEKFEVCYPYVHIIQEDNAEQQ